MMTIKKEDNRSKKDKKKERTRKRYGGMGGQKTNVAVAPLPGWYEKAS